MPHDVDLTNRLNELLLATAQAFLRAAQQNHRGRAAEYEICLAVRRRPVPVSWGG